MSDVRNGAEQSEVKVPAQVEESKPARRETSDIFSLMQEEMNRLWGAWPFGGPLRRRMGAANALMPRTDVFERGDKLVVKAELPGLTKDEVDVSIEDGDLVIQAEHKAESEVKEDAYYRMERSVGKVYRRIPLPEGTDPDQIDAALENGVLEVTLPLPRKQDAAPKKVTIR